MNTNSKTALICATVLIAIILGGVGFLAYHGTISGGEAMTVLTGVLGIVGGVFAVQTGAKAVAQAQAVQTQAANTNTQPVVEPPVVPVPASTERRSTRGEH